MRIKRIDHISLVVNNLSTVKDFFLDFGFTILGEAEEQSELLAKVIGIKDAKS